MRTPQAIERKGNYSEPHNNYRIKKKKKKKKIKKYLLFDLDGTLTDPKIGITTCVQYALHSFGIEEPDLDKLEPFIGPPLRDSFMEFYGFTAEPQIYVERILEHFDLKKYFAVVVGSELDGTRETKDQVVQETLHQLFKENPIEPDQVYMIGDRKFDVEGARALGVESVGVTYGYGSKEELKEAKADYIVQSVEELEKFLLRGSEELVNSNPDNKKKNPMYQRIWTMVYSFLMFILVRNAVQYALLALLYQLAQSGASGGLVDLLILRDETGAYNGYSGDVSSIIAALGFIGGALAVWSTAKLLITKNKEDMHLSHLKKEGKAKYALLVAATIGAVIGFNLLFELLGVTNKSEAYTEVAAQQYSAHFIVGILVFGFISPIAEELLFRGVIYGYLRRFMDIKLAIALSALIFGVYHMNYVQGVYGFLIGCLMAYAYEYFGEFKMAVFVHVASNVLAYCLSYTSIAVTGFVSWPVCVVFLAVAVVSLITLVTSSDRIHKLY